MVQGYILPLPVTCSSSTIHWFNLILTTAVWFGVIVVRPLVPNYKNYKIGRHEASVLRLQLYDSLFEI